jgi:antirestriction protein ArdC
MMLTGEVKVMGFTSPTWISLKNASETAARVSSAWEEGTAKQMECSLLA